MSDAAVIGFDDRVLWTAAVGTITGGEDFEGFLADTSFDGGALGLSSGMTIGSLVAGGDNIVDVVPLITSESDVNGTANARIFTGGSPPGVTPFVTFATPVSGFGADFVNLNDDFARTSVEVYSGAILLDTLPS